MCASVATNSTFSLHAHAALHVCTIFDVFYSSKTLLYSREISFSLRFGCDVPHHLDEGVRLEIRTPAKRWQPIRYYTPSLTTPSASLVTLNEDNATVVAEALTYSSTFPLEVVRGNQLLVIHEYICDDAFWDTSVSIRWMQRYNDSSDFAVNKSTWSLDNVSIVFWNGECRQEVLANNFHNGSAV